MYTCWLWRACGLTLVAWCLKPFPVASVQPVEKFSAALQVRSRQLAMVLSEPWQQVVVFNSFWHPSPPVCERCDCELWRSPARAVAALQVCEIRNTPWSPSLFLMLRRSCFFVFAYMSFLLCPVEVLNSETGPLANDPIISYSRSHVKSFFAWSLKLGAFFFLAKCRI